MTYRNIKTYSFAQLLKNEKHKSDKSANDSMRAPLPPVAMLNSRG